MPKVDNILYLDFDGTLTGVRGQEVIDEALCQNLKDKSTQIGRQAFKSQYDQQESKFKINEEAKSFLNKVNALHPQVNIVIVSNNYSNYIKAVLEFENIDHQNITFYTKDKSTGLKGEDVKKHEVGRSPGLRLICDDGYEWEEMAVEAGREHREQKIIRAYTEKPSEFKWDEYLKEINNVCTLQNQLSDSKEPDEICNFIDLHTKLEDFKKSIDVFSKTVNTENSQNTGESYIRKKRLLSEAEKIHAHIDNVIKNDYKTLSSDDVDELKKVVSACTDTLKAVNDKNPERAQEHVEFLANASRQSYALKALNVSLLTFGGLALLVAGITIAAILAIPTCGGSLAMAAAATAVTTTFGVAGGSAVVAGKIIEKQTDKQAYKDPLSNFKQALTDLKPSDIEAPEKPKDSDTQNNSM